MIESFRALEPGRKAAVSVVLIVVAILAPIIILLWPGAPVGYEGSSVEQDYPRAKLSEVRFDDCESVTDEVPCGTAVGTLTETGEDVEVMLYRNAYFNQAADGDTAILFASVYEDGSSIHTFYSPDRAWVLILGGLVVLGVVAIGAGRQGVRALVSLVASAAFIWLFLVGGIAADGSPLLYTAVTLVLVLTMVLFYTHGLSAKTLAAWLGTMTGVGLAMAFGALLTHFLRLGPVDESASLLTLTGLTVSVETLSLAALLVVLVGVLNDISAAQASTVFSHAAGQPDAHGHGGEPPDRENPSLRHVVRASLAVGRDHASSAIYTVTFAMVGASLSMLVLAQAYGRPIGVVLLSDEAAAMVSQTLAGLVGVIAAMLLTTFFAALFARIWPESVPSDRSGT